MSPADGLLSFSASASCFWLIQTDDALPFRTNLVAEYALLLAAPPLGLGLSEAEVAKISQMGMKSRFR